MNTPLLQLEQVTKTYDTRHGKLVALDPFDLTIDAGRPEIVAVAGESGSGKSTLANLLLGFERPTSGAVRFDGRSLAAFGRRDWRNYRARVQAVFQDPYSSFNPAYRVRHVFEVVARSFGLSKVAATEGRTRALNSVGLDDDVLAKFPHQLSGGQRQRVMIARALTLDPALVVADEPVSMVDASMRATILDIIARLRDERQISFIYITHDLSTVYQVADRLILLYQGAVAEQGGARSVITAPAHPYSRQLVSSVPEIDRVWQGTVEVPTEETRRLGEHVGCRYAPRCTQRFERCDIETPVMFEVAVGSEPKHTARCFLHDTGERSTS